MKDILIVGGGGLGSFLASKLIPFARVSITCRSNFDQVFKCGLNVTSDGISYHATPFKVYRNTVEASSSHYDHVVLTTKALASIDNVKLLGPVIKPSTMIHIIQNGVGIEDSIRNAFPDSPLSSTVAYIGVWQEKPGYIVQKGHVSFTIGEYGSPKARSKLQEFVDLLLKTGLPVTGPVDKVQLARWHKLLWNTSFNPISIIAGGKKCGHLLSSAEMETLIRDVMHEVQSASLQIQGKPFPEKYMSIDGLIHMTKRDLQDYKPSMLLDWEANREMEVEAILGNPIRIAKQHGISMSKLETLYQLLKFKVYSRQTEGDS